MKLHSLTLYNFMPYKGEQRIDFPVRENCGIVVIYGDNMRGKTSLLNAIRWVFFGKAVARHGRVVPAKDIVNIEAVTESADWSSWVEVEFESGGSNYELRRSLKLTKSVAHPTKDDDFQTDLQMFKDNVKLNHDETGDEINQLLPEQISRFFLFDGELLQDYETLVRDPSPSQGIKAAIERILGVPALINGRDELGTLLQRAQTAQAKDLKQVKSMRSQAEQQLRLQTDVDEISNRLASFRTRKKQLEQSITETDEKLELLAEQMDRLDDYFEAKARKREISTGIENLFSRRATWLQEAWRDLMYPQLEPQLDGLRLQQRKLLEDYTTKAKRLAELDLLEASYNQGSCDICRQEIPRGKKRNISQRLGALQGELKATDLDISELSSISAQIERVSQIKGMNAHESIVEIENELDNFGVELTRVENVLETLGKEVDPNAQDEILRLTNGRVPLQVEIGKIEQEIGVAESNIDELMRKQAQIARLLARNPEARRQRSSALVDKYGALFRIFTSSVDKLRSKQRDRVANYAAKAFSKLTTETQYKRLEINENYGLSIIDDEDRPVAERSAGAEQVIALSLINGLNKVARRNDPIVMDTPFGRLDKKHRMNILSFLPEMADQVILLVHEGEMSRDSDLQIISDHVSALYNIERVSARQSKLSEGQL